MPFCTFNIMTVKGSKGAIELDTDSPVQDLYDQAKKLVGWSDAEDDFYVLILAGKKLVDPTAKLNTFKLAAKASVVATKVNKSWKVPATPTSPSASIASPTPAANTSTDMTDATPASPKPAATTTTTTPTPAATTTTTTTTSANNSMSDETTTTPPQAAATTTTTTTTADATSSTTNTADKVDLNTLTDVDFTALFSNPDNFKLFFDVLEQINPDLSAQLAANPAMAMNAFQLLARRHHNGADKVDLNAIVDAVDDKIKAAPRPAPRNQEIDEEAQMRALQRSEEKKQSRALSQDFNEKDKAAIARLQELGFSEAQVTKAYVICDKNEEYAANYLFDHGNE